VPTVGFLYDADAAPAPADGVPQSTDAREDGSLGIGSMKGESG
jgi:hypothetical protein